MSGLLRNILAILLGCFSYGSRATDQMTSAHFLITPFDTGVRVLKSDKYLQLAETAQVDYLLQTGRFLPLLRSGVAFVNVAQLVKFLRPVAVFSCVRVETRLIYADQKCAYFSHELHAHGALAAEVLVKVKFKKGRQTVPPCSFLAFSFAAAPPKVQMWDSALASL